MKDKLTRSPQASAGSDIDALREVGLSDTDILNATHVIGFFNHINRVADALDVDLEPEMPPKST